MHAKTMDILNDAAAIARRDQWFGQMRHLFDGVPSQFTEEYVFSLCGKLGRAKTPGIELTNPEQWVDECLDELALQLDPEAEKTRFVPYCVEYGIYGVHFINKILGADVFFQAGQWNGRYLPHEVGELKMPDLASDPTWALAKRAACAFVQSGVSLPLFGMPTLSSVLNIAVNLYGQEFLVAMMIDEDAARHDLEIIHQVIYTLHKWYVDNLPSRQLQPVISWLRTQPPGYGQLCGCTCQLISAQSYADFIAAYDDALLGLYPGGGMIHLCGKHVQHIGTFRGMKNLKAIQVNDRACEDLAAYFEGLREDQIIYVNPCEKMPAERAIQLTCGRRIVLVEAAVTLRNKPCACAACSHV